MKHFRNKETFETFPETVGINSLKLSPEIIICYGNQKKKNLVDLSKFLGGLVVGERYCNIL